MLLAGFYPDRFPSLAQTINYQKDRQVYGTETHQSINSRLMFHGAVQKNRTTAKMPIMVNARAILSAAPRTRPMVAPMPARVACWRFSARRKLADHGADEWAEDDAWKTNKHASDGADQRADDRALGSAEFFRAKHGRPKIDAVSE